MADAPNPFHVAMPPAPRAQDCAESVLRVMPTMMEALRGAMRRQAGDPLSVPQYRCLHHVASQPGCSPGAVAAFLGVTLPTASTLVDRLVKAGALAPGVAAADRRRSALTLTTAGRTQMRQIERGARGEFARALASCSGAELQAVLAGLAVLQRAFAAA